MKAEQSCKSKLFYDMFDCSIQIFQISSKTTNTFDDHQMIKLRCVSMTYPIRMTLVLNSTASSLNVLIK